jgi:hypothetical protein
MKLLGRVLFGVALSLVVAAVSFAPVSAAVTPVVVKQCFVTPPKAMSKKASGTQIDYVIYGHRDAKSITFAVAYRNSQNTFMRKVTDVGTFAPGAEIKHHFDLYSDVTYGGETVRSCVPIQVKWADATLWMAPAH